MTKCICELAVATIHPLEGEQKSVTLRLDDLLTFVTGADRIPPLGFCGGIGIRFLHGQECILPVASTCGPYISLPTCYRLYDDFKGTMIEGIVSGFGFGLV